jgi:hypothetical protein
MIHGVSGGEICNIFQQPGHDITCWSLFLKDLEEGLHMHKSAFTVIHGGFSYCLSSAMIRAKIGLRVKQP